MKGPDSNAQLTRLLEELARLETEIRTSSLRDPQTLAEYADRVAQLRRDVLRHQAGQRSDR